MSTSHDADFWRRQSTSLHRFGDESFYARKAAEHASLMAEADLAGPVVDLGCGAGELLAQFIHHARVVEAIDYSDSMLAAARERLKESKVVLKQVDLFPYIQSLEAPVWVTTAAINQYLEPSEMTRFLELFARNQNAKALYLFDCVDHVRHALLFHGIGYKLESANGSSGTPPLRQALGRVYRRMQFASNMLSGRFASPARRLGQEGMGLGFLPYFWNDAGKRLGLNVECIGSREYEYRYHVILRKSAV